ncbi:MAG: NAD(P)/FAD-dependent oxidoreductase, partial [Bacillota bacterium]
ILPSKLIPFIIKLSDIPPDKIVNSITKAERRALIKLLKNLEFELTSLDDINNAVITAGGVSTKEINPKTMMSKIVNNLYFAGEIIDIDALTGGFNLQLAFSTGFVAGTYAKQQEEK